MLSGIWINIKVGIIHTQRGSPTQTHTHTHTGIVKLLIRYAIDETTDYKGIRNKGFLIIVSHENDDGRK